MQQRHVLALYYSMTQQTAQVMQRVATTLEVQQHQVELVKLRPLKEWTVPMDKAEFFRYWLKMMWLQEEPQHPIQPLQLQRKVYDCIVLGFQPWNLQISIPMNNFLESDDAEILRNTDVVLVITARGRWERCYRLAREKVERRGGRVMDVLVLLHPGKEPANIITTVYHLFEHQDPTQHHFFGDKVPPFGLTEQALKSAEQFGHELGMKLGEAHYRIFQGWRLVGESNAWM
ncbi:MAG: hypothetical protein ACKO6N_12405 [Myxococcota bacterium]